MRGAYRRPDYDGISAAYRQECLVSIRVACSRARVKDRAEKRTRLADIHRDVARMPRTPWMSSRLIGALLRSAGVIVEQIGGAAWVLHGLNLDAFVEQRPQMRPLTRTPVR